MTRMYQQLCLASLILSVAFIHVYLTQQDLVATWIFMEIFYWFWSIDIIKEHICILCIYKSRIMNNLLIVYDIRELIQVWLVWAPLWVLSQFVTWCQSGCVLFRCCSKAAATLGATGASLSKDGFALVGRNPGTSQMQIQYIIPTSTKIT